MVKIAKKIKNVNYRNFLDKGLIDFISKEQLELALNNVAKQRNKHKVEGRALLIALYYTGARPNEILNLKSKDITIEKSFVKVKVPASKGGLPRTIFLPYRLKLVKELYKYATSVYPEMLLFFNYRGSYSRKVITKTKGVVFREEITDRLRYYVNKWFTGVVKGSISPYFLRHSRFSQLAEAGVSLDDIRFMKGARSIESVMPYLHLSTHKAKKISKKIK